MGSFLSDDARDELLDELKIERKRKYADRLRVILLLDKGWTYRAISEALFLDESSIANYKRRYLEGGIDKLVNDHYIGRKMLLTKDQIKVLTCRLEKEIFSSTFSVIDFVKEEFGVRYSKGGMTDLLHRLGYSFKKATPIPGKADRNQQEDFVEFYESIKNKGKVYFLDATHPEYAPNITYGWIRRGKDFEVKTNSGWRKRVNVLGALDVESLDSVVRTYKTINSASVCDLIKSIRKKNIDEQQLYLILYGAAYNRSNEVKYLAKKLKIKLIYLPAYSPNLNPIERLWKFMKKKVTANRYFETFEEFREEVVSFFRSLRKHHNELETLITDEFNVLGT